MEMKTSSRGRRPIQVATVLALILLGRSFAADTPRSYEDAKAIWEKSSSTVAYQDYSAEFSQFNNHFHLDEKDGCYALGTGPVSLMLIITHQESDEFAVIERVLSNVDNAKARCFKKSYSGVRTKAPPFFPFVLQMSMG